MKLGTPIASGNTAKIYLSDDKVVKVFHATLPDTESSNEAFKQQYVRSLGLPVPKIVEITKIDGRQAIIMEHIKGTTLGAILMENRDQAEKYMEISVDIQRRIHQVVAHSLEPMSEKLTRQIKTAHLLNNDQQSALINRLDAMSFEKKLCHGDFHLFNLIVSDHDVTIIDWVDASSGDIRADVYRTYLLYSQFSVELAEMYLRLYCKKSSLLKENVFQWAPMIAAARLSEAVSTERAERLIEIVNAYIPS